MLCHARVKLILVDVIMIIIVVVLMIIMVIASAVHVMVGHRLAEGSTRIGLHRHAAFVVWPRPTTLPWMSGHGRGHTASGHAGVTFVRVDISMQIRIRVLMITNVIQFAVHVMVRHRGQRAARRQSLHVPRAAGHIFSANHISSSLM